MNQIIDAANALTAEITADYEAFVEGVVGGKLTGELPTTREEALVAARAAVWHSVRYGGDVTFSSLRLAHAIGRLAGGVKYEQVNEAGVHTIGRLCQWIILELGMTITASENERGPQWSARASVVGPWVDNLRARWATKRVELTRRTAEVLKGFEWPNDWSQWEKDVILHQYGIMPDEL